MKGFLIAFLFLIGMVPNIALAQDRNEDSEETSLFEGLKFRNIGPFRGGRSVASTGDPTDPSTYYMGTCGGGIWKTIDAGVSWKNISDGFFNTGSVGAIEIAPSDNNVLYAGMGEHAVRGVMTSHGDGVYKTVDAGKTWTHLGLENSRHIAEIQIHPTNPDLLWVAAQGAANGPSEDRGVYKSEDGGENWKKVLYVDENTGAADLSMDDHNPRILYAGMWDHQRYPWQVRSGGPGSGLYKSTDGGESWKKLTKGLPEKMGKVSIDVSRANSEVVYANIESAGEKGGVYRSNDGGKTWNQTSKDRVTVARAWYYIEIFADPMDSETVYVLNAPVLKSIDGGKTFKTIPNPHGDQHHLWINPKDNNNVILSNDGGACISFNGGKTWSSQQNQPTAQFYRVITDNRFPYHVYGGQQDNSTVCTPSRTNGNGINWKDWYAVSGCESAFMAFDPDNPVAVYGGCYQGNISLYDHTTGDDRDIMAYPVAGLGWNPADMKYRFNWNAPIVSSPQNSNVIFHGGNKVLKTQDGGLSWEEISPDLTRNEKSKHVDGGAPYTNEGAGGEVYNTLSYIETSIHDERVLWTGSDCGLVHLTRNGGKKWSDVTPKDINGEALINCIDVSPHDSKTAFLAVTKYKFNDFTPLIYRTDNYGRDWRKITNGIDENAFVRVVREDPVRKGLLYAGTELGLYISFNNGKNWEKFQQNLPICPITDLDFRDNDLVVATMGRAFWILDDLGALQQSKGDLSGDPILFQPKNAFRFFGGKGGLTSGKNPPNGMIIDYYLPEDMDSSVIVLEIYNKEGKLLREYSNQKDKLFKKYIGGPSIEPNLSSKKGVNRFTWDLKTESIPGIENVFVLGGYDGSVIAPGDVELRLRIEDKKELRQDGRVIADPRVNAKSEDYENQAEILQELEATVRAIHISVNKMRKISERIRSLENSLKDQDDAVDLIAAGKEIQEKISEWERNLIQPKQKTFQDVINFPNKLNSEILNLMDRIGGWDPKVTRGAQERKEILIKEWLKHSNTMQVILNKNVSSYNDLYNQLNIPAVIIPVTIKP